MKLEHQLLKQRFLNGEALSQQEIKKLCQFEGDRWPLSLWQEEQAFTRGKTA
jgi:hypothetical protein